KTKNTEDSETLMAQMEYDIDRWRNNETLQEMNHYSMSIYDQRYSVLDDVPEDSLVIIDDMRQVQKVAHSLATEEAELYESLLEQRQIAPGMTFSFDFEDVWAKKHYQTIYMSLFMRHIKGTQPQNIVNVSSRAMQEFHGQMPLFEQEMERWKKA